MSLIETIQEEIRSKETNIMVIEKQEFLKEIKEKKYPLFILVPILKDKRNKDIEDHIKKGYK